MDVKKVQFQRFAGRETPEEIVARARAEARRLVEHAKADADRIERQAYEQGFTQGEQGGLKMGMIKAQPAVDGLIKLIEELDRLLLKTLESMEPEIIRLVQVVAEKVIHTTIAADSRVMIEVVKAALAEAEQKWDVTVRVSRQEYDTLSQFTAEFERLRRAGRVAVVADETLPSGGCVVETPVGFVDASVQRAIDELFKLEE
jgi:flagellar assembly protein FliH